MQDLTPKAELGLYFTNQCAGSNPQLVLFDTALAQLKTVAATSFLSELNIAFPDPCAALGCMAL